MIQRAVLRASKNNERKEQDKSEAAPGKEKILADFPQISTTIIFIALLER